MQTGPTPARSVVVPSRGPSPFSSVLSPLNTPWRSAQQHDRGPVCHFHAQSQSNQSLDQNLGSEKPPGCFVPSAAHSLNSGPTEGTSLFVAHKGDSTSSLMMQLHLGVCESVWGFLFVSISVWFCFAGKTKVPFAALGPTCTEPGKSS